ncbi:kelch repeat-containing protein [Candidatus Bathycorpusculum sp.]|uniref:Kelch repeat-containing protein n=1 Tax=Candidatus Bathycorpusculum sp. TaxID=2994959 RepID=UPI002834EA64|nr:hypothetical protein [Candidatus Termitimicrobium sp.]MCL2431594.1 hypothetical protein [Candidatus Termitimicrobium sp.]
MDIITKHIQILTITLISLILLPAINIPYQVSAETSNSSWTTVKSMSTARGDFGVAEVGGKIYVIGGINETNTPLGIVEEYNPVTNTWTTKKSMPTPRSGLAVAVYGDKIYAIGGTVGNVYVGNNEMYDPATDRWEQRATMPTPRAGLCANVVNGSIYLIGGEKFSSTMPFYGETDINEVYNPATDSWTTKAPLPKAVKGYGSAVVNNKIYVIGGSNQTYSTSNSGLVNNNQVYDVQTDQWTSARAFPFTVSRGAAVATTGYHAPQRIYYFGGFSAEKNNRTEMFDPVTNSWNTLESMPRLKERLGVVSVSDVLYIIGGFDGNEWVSTVEQFKPMGYGSVPPVVQITSPENKTYRDVLLVFTVNRDTTWTGYSLDGQPNRTVGSQTTLGLSQGSHRIVIYANDSTGNMGISNTVYFSVDTVGPTIVILSPLNKAYNSADIELTFSLDKPATALTYSLNGEEQRILAGNMTLPALPPGGYWVTVYATDELGNTSEKTVYFDIEPFPFVLIVAVILIIIIVIATVYLLYKRKNAKAKTASNTEIET